MDEVEPADPQVQPEQMRQEAKRILAKAHGEELALRLLGALAFEYQCPKFGYLRDAMGRVLSDLDFMGLSAQWNAAVDMLGELGYAYDRRYALLHSNERMIFFHDDGFRVDVFLDRLDMCHAIDFRQRMDLDPDTLSISDLLLEKLQIVKLTRKDVIDTIVLMREHDVGQSENQVNAIYISDLFSNDWGFYYTATENLKFIRQEAFDGFDALREEDAAIVSTRIDRLIQAIEAEPKGRKWQIRSAIGPRVRWYKEVGDLTR
jgi:hypothetical protein